MWNNKRLMRIARAYCSDHSNKIKSLIKMLLISSLGYIIMLKGGILYFKLFLSAVNIAYVNLYKKSYSLMYLLLISFIGGLLLVVVGVGYLGYSLLLGYGLAMVALLLRNTWLVGRGHWPLLIGWYFLTSMYMGVALAMLYPANELVHSISSAADPYLMHIVRFVVGAITVAFIYNTSLQERGHWRVIISWYFLTSMWLLALAVLYPTSELLYGVGIAADPLNRGLTLPDLILKVTVGATVLMAIESKAPLRAWLKSLVITEQRYRKSVKYWYPVKEFVPQDFRFTLLTTLSHFYDALTGNHFTICRVNFRRHRTRHCIIADGTWIGRLRYTYALFYYLLPSLNGGVYVCVQNKYPPEYRCKLRIDHVHRNLYLRRPGPRGPGNPPKAPLKHRDKPTRGPGWAGLRWARQPARPGRDDRPKIHRPPRVHLPRRSRRKRSPRLLRKRGGTSASPKTQA